MTELSKCPNHQYTEKRMTVVQADAIKILAAEQTGFQVALADQAKRALLGEVLHPMMGAAMCTEATRIHNHFRQSDSLIIMANRFANTIYKACGFALN